MILFHRALADQLEGNEDEHNKYRNMVVQYIVVSKWHFIDFSSLDFWIISPINLDGFYRKIVRCLSLLSKMMFHLRITVKP